MVNALRVSWRSIRAELRLYRNATWRERWDHFWHGRDWSDGGWGGFGGPPT
jgi:hypothetical protein